MIIPDINLLHGGRGFHALPEPPLPESDHRYWQQVLAQRPASLSCDRWIDAIETLHVVGYRVSEKGGAAGVGDREKRATRRLCMRTTRIQIYGLTLF